LLRDAEFVHIWPQRVYIGTGTANDEPIEDVGKLKALFQKAGLSDDRLRVVVQDGGTHSELWWAQRLPQALQFLFPTAKTPTGRRLTVTEGHRHSRVTIVPAIRQIQPVTTNNSIGSQKPSASSEEKT